MPAERVLPVCPLAVATAKPGRVAWAREELEDALATVPGGRVEPSSHPGVFLLYATVDPCGLARELLEWDYSFVRTIVIASVTAECAGGVELIVRRVAGECLQFGGPVRLSIRLRGSCKRVELEGLGVERLRVHRSSRVALALEGVEGCLLASCGRVRDRPYGVTLIVPIWCEGWAGRVN